MALKHRYADGWYKNAAGLYVQMEPIDRTLVAAASTDQVVAKKSDGTLYLKTVSGGGGGLTAPTLRSSAIQSSSASSYNVNFPTGAAAGDLCVLMAGHGWNANNPAGWTVIDNSAGANFNGGAWAKQLAAADITTGHVTLSFGGSYNGVIAILCFTGLAGALRASYSSRNDAGASTRSVTSSWDVATTDYVIYFGAHRANDTVTCSLGTALQSIAASEASGVLTGEVPATGGTTIPVWSYPTTTSGDYQIMIVLEGR